jgi:hypothetical protein
MARNSDRASVPHAQSRAKRSRIAIAEPFRVVTSATVGSSSEKIEVPMLVLYGEWLKAAGFPIGTSAYVIADRRGELTLNRLGLSRPRRVRIRAMPR